MSTSASSTTMSTTETITLPSKALKENPIDENGLSNEFITLHSPMMVVTREYYQNSGKVPPTFSHFFGNHQTLHPELQGVSTGRRHSIMDGRLYRQMSDWNLKSAPASRRGSTSNFGTNAQTNSTGGSIHGSPNLSEKTTKQEPSNTEISSAEISASETTSTDDDSSTGSKTPRLFDTRRERILNPLDPRYLGGIPHDHTTARLLELGKEYLKSRETADAFVRATPITKTPRPARPQSFPSGMFKPAETHLHGIPPSPQSDAPHIHTTAPQTTKSSMGSGGGCMIRVKIVPKRKDRKAFIMQKHFPARQPRGPHRNLLRPVPCEGIGKEYAQREIRSRKSQKQEASGCIPIHVEYVAYRAPLLAAILFSGHVHKGDILEIPMPYPLHWPRVVEWIYTGNIGNISPEEIENIEYLGGHL